MPLSIADIAIPFGIVLVSFLAYSSQYLFLYLQPGPLTARESWIFNLLVAGVWISYYRSCSVDPGHVPKDWKPSGVDDDKRFDSRTDSDNAQRQRWCRKCEALKPPRAHHCKICGRCIPRMDHHCPWTRNCVSYFTFPHYIRFLFYGVASMVYLEKLLFTRLSVIWQTRHKPSYLGPSVSQLAHLFILFVVLNLTLIAISVLLLRAMYSLGANVTTIESWEIERHETLLRRARHFGGYLDGPDGMQIRIKKQEFPYDIGIWQNIRDGMGGSSNVLSWFWPLAATPDRRGGYEFEVNGFEDPSVSWPPPDPDRIPRKTRATDAEGPFSVNHYESQKEEIEAFYYRQQEDMQRRRPSVGLARRRKFHTRLESDRDEEVTAELSENELSSQSGSDYEGEESWRNADGERLDDFGVDEEVEFYDEDNIPLAELMRRRREKQL